MFRPVIALLAAPAVLHCPLAPVAAAVPEKVVDVEALIRTVADEAGLPEEFCLRIAYRESRYDQWATSDEGAMGIMQLMPATAKYLGVDDPYDPEENIRGGVGWLGALYRQYGSLEMADCVYSYGQKGCEEALE